MKHTEMTLEQISALVDGQLQGTEFAQAMDRMGEADALRSTWSTYHLIGDVLRSGVHAPCTDNAAFVTRLQQRLARESVSAVPRPVAVPATPVAVPALPHIEAANEPVFRWKLVAGAASLAAAAAIGWNWVGSGAVPAGPQLAQQQVPTVLASTETSRPAPVQLESNQVLVGNRPQVMLRDPRLDQLLEAHQQAGGASQMPSGFLRNATFEGPSR